MIWLALGRAAQARLWLTCSQGHVAGSADATSDPSWRWTMPGTAPQWPGCSYCDGPVSSVQRMPRTA